MREGYRTPKISEGEKFKPYGYDTMTSRGFEGYRDMLYGGADDQTMHNLLKDGVVDVGAGGGMFAFGIKEKFPDLADKVFSVDVHDWDKIEKERLKRATDNDFFNVDKMYDEQGMSYEQVHAKREQLEKLATDKSDYIKAKSQFLPFKDNSIGEVVTNFGPLHYIPLERWHTCETNEQLRDLKIARNALLVIYEMLRIAKPGGKVRITPLYSPESYKEGLAGFDSSLPKIFNTYFKKILDRCNIHLDLKKWTEEMVKNCFGDYHWTTVLTKPEIASDNDGDKIDQLAPFREMLDEMDDKIQELSKKE